MFSQIMIMMMCETCVDFMGFSFLFQIWWFVSQVKPTFDRFLQKNIISNLYGSPKPQIQSHSINPSEHSFETKSISWTFELFFDQHFKWLKSHLNSNTFLEFSYRKSLHEFDIFVRIIYGCSWNSVI
jgi:hypothetical protein